MAEGARVKHVNQSASTLPPTDRPPGARRYRDDEPSFEDEQMLSPKRAAARREERDIKPEQERPPGDRDIHCDSSRPRSRRGRSRPDRHKNTAPHAITPQHTTAPRLSLLTTHCGRPEGAGQPASQRGRVVDTCMRIDGYITSRHESPNGEQSRVCTAARRSARGRRVCTRCERSASGEARCEKIGARGDVRLEAWRSSEGLHCNAERLTVSLSGLKTGLACCRRRPRCAGRGRPSLRR